MTEKTRVCLTAGLIAALGISMVSCGKKSVEMNRKNTSSAETVSSTTDSGVESLGESAVGDDALPDESAVEAAATDDGAKESKEDTSSEGKPLYLKETHGPREYDGAAENDDFSDACFIGDSRTKGLLLNCDKPKADFFCEAGLNVQTIWQNQIIKNPDYDPEHEKLDENGDPIEEYELVTDAVKHRKYKRIFINFGTNELGWPSPDIFVADYVDLITQVRLAQPDAVIYVENVLPVSYLAQETDTVFTTFNVDYFNENYIKRVARESNSVYLDINQFFRDSRGDLYYDASEDGIHLTREYYLEWMDILAFYTTGRGDMSTISDGTYGTKKDEETGLPVQILPQDLPDVIIPGETDTASKAAEDDSSEAQTEESSQEDTDTTYTDDGTGYGYDDTYYGYDDTYYGYY